MGEQEQHTDWVVLAIIVAGVLFMMAGGCGDIDWDDMRERQWETR